tara:strand:+ start:265 stop:630 length:366 start_codon:yes stop_codon:yes gene_type:complete
MATNKHFCQGTNCHQYITTDRFLKSKGIIRGRYANSPIATSNNEDKRWHRYDYRSDTYFCSLGCKLDWLNNNMANIEQGIPIPFIRERRFSEGYEKKTTTHESWDGRSYQSNSIHKIETNS